MLPKDRLQKGWYVLALLRVIFCVSELWPFVQVGALLEKREGQEHFQPTKSREEWNKN
jgi:hypothetical protein